MTPEHDRRHVHEPQDDRTAHESRQLGKDRQHGHREHRGQHARQHEKLYGRQAERRKRVQLFVHLHRPDLGGERAPAPAREDDGRHKGAQLAEKADGDQIRHVHLHSEHLERGGGLEREDQSQQKSDERGDRQAVHARALEGKRRVAEPKPTGMPQHAQRPDGGLAEERGVLAEDPPAFAHVPSDSRRERKPPVRRVRNNGLARIGGKIVARADRPQHVVRVDSLHRNLMRDGVPIKRHEERLERRTALRQGRDVQQDFASLPQTVHAPQITPHARDLVRPGVSDHDRLHFAPV